MDREKTAWHEAGHAVAACHMGVGFRGVYLDTMPVDSGELHERGVVVGGFIWLRPEPSYSLRYRDTFGFKGAVRKQVMVTMSGIAGEIVLYCLRVRHLRIDQVKDQVSADILANSQGSMTDFDDATSFAGTMFGCEDAEAIDYVSETLGRAIEFAFKRRDRIEAVAEELEAKGELSSSEVHAIIREVREKMGRPGC